jgi:hypothetical protein
LQSVFKATPVVLRKALKLSWEGSEMLPRRFTDPFGSRLLALERTIIRLRGLQMLLAMFYAEELKRDVLSLIRTTDKLMIRLPKGELASVRVPEGTKNPVNKALTALVADRAITPVEKAEIITLIDYRNVIAHQMHNLLADISPERSVRQMYAFRPDKTPKYDYNAVERLQHFHRHLDGLHRTHGYVYELSYNKLFFRSADKMFLAEIRRLRAKAHALNEQRQEKIKALNAELSLKGTEIKGDRDPQHPLSKYDDGRLTKRGVEICYRLFDMGKSSIAVAHLTDLSLSASRKRMRMWAAAGGADRAKVNIETLPRRKFYARYDD